MWLTWDCYLDSWVVAYSITCRTNQLIVYTIHLGPLGLLYWCFWTEFKVNILKKRLTNLSNQEARNVGRLDYIHTYHRKPNYAKEQRLVSLTNPSNSTIPHDHDPTNQTSNYINIFSFVSKVMKLLGFLTTCKQNPKKPRSYLTPNTRWLNTNLAILQLEGSG